MVPLPELIVFRLRHSDEDTLRQIVVESRNVLPTEDHLQIDTFERFGDQVGGTQHGEEIQEGQALVNVKSLVEESGKM